MQWKLFAKMHYISPVLSTDIYFILHIINSEIVAICSVFYEALQIWISDRISYTRTTHSISYSTRLLTTNFSTFHLKTKVFVQPNFAVGSPPGSLGCPKTLSAVSPKKSGTWILAFTDLECLCLLSFFLMACFQDFIFISLGWYFLYTGIFRYVPFSNEHLLKFFLFLFDLSFIYT